MLAAPVLLALLSASAPPVEPAAAPAGSPARALALVPFTTGGDQSEANRAYVEETVVSWVRRWGQPVDDAKAVQERLGAGGGEQLAACVAEPDCLVSAYRAVLSGRLSYGAEGWRLLLVVMGADGQRWMSLSISAPLLTELLDKVVSSAQEIADEVGRRTGRSIHYDRPTRPYATVPFIVAGATLATSIVFFVLSGKENSKLSNASLPLSDAVSARNAAHTYAIVGYSLTAVGIAAAVVGLFLYQPGARPPGPAVTVGVDPSRGLLLLSGRFP